MIFHENRLLADDFHEDEDVTKFVVCYFILLFHVIGALRANYLLC